MLVTKFDLHFPYRVVIYLRMSQEGQNPRSPDQQHDVISELIQRLKLPWIIVAVYRDDAKSARFTSKRPDYQRMRRDLKSGAILANLILVDTFERLTRADNGDEIRRGFEKMGLLVLTANSGFTDPTTTSGKALAMFESLRASEDGKVKAHNVLRGKRDAARLKQWPGGAAPFGMRLYPVYKDVKGIKEVAYRVPEPDPETKWMVEEIFRLADELGYGTARIAEALNGDSRIAEDLKPFHPSTIGYILDADIYQGDYVWGKNCTGVVDDRRVVQPLPEKEWLRIPDFCEAIIDRERWNRVKTLRDSRRQQKGSKQDGNAAQKAVITAPGLALKYPLSGLVFCAHCGRRMNAQSSSPYSTVDGESRRYVGYGCPGLAGGLCHNHKRIPEEWLRITVFDLVRQRLHLNQCDVQSPALMEFIEVVQRQLAAFGTSQPAPAAAWKKEKAELVQRCRGWLQSLGNPSLAPLVRSQVEIEYESAQARVHEIEAKQAAHVAGQNQREHIANPQAIIDRLQQLGSILKGQNSSAMNLMLSQHIDSIICDETGQVIVRTCKLGALSSDLDLFTSDASDPTVCEPSTSRARYAGKPRRRARLDIADAIEEDDEADNAREFAVDTYRFAGLSPEWFDEDIFTVPVTLSWAEANALEVAKYRLTSKQSMEKTAQRFGKTVPTIRQALRYAKDKHGIDALGKGISRPTLPNWSREYAQEVTDFMQQPNASMKAAVQFFGKSEPTIRKSIEIGKGKAAADGGSEGETGNSAVA